MSLSNWNKNNILKFSVDNENVDAPLTDFPVLLNLSSGSGINNFDCTDIFNELYISGEVTDIHILLLIHTDEATYSTSVTDSSSHSFNITTSDVEHNSAVYHFNGSSLYFEGTLSSYILVEDTSYFHIGTDDFTIDVWLKLESRDFTLVDLGAYGTGLAIGTTAGSLYLGVGGSFTDIPCTAIELNVWGHLAIVRKNLVFTLYWEGVLFGTISTLSGGISAGSLKIGADDSNFTSKGLRGNMQEFRFIKEAVWLENFTPPTSIYTGLVESNVVVNKKIAVVYPSVQEHWVQEYVDMYNNIDTNTKLLIHANETSGSNTIADNSSSEHTITAWEDAVVKDFNADGNSIVNYSVFFNGSDGYLTFPDHTDWDIGTDDFTVELWANVSDFDNRALVGSSADDTHRWLFYFNSASTELRFFTYVPGVIVNVVASITWGVNEWHHYAAVRVSGTIYLYVDGVQIASGANTASLTVMSDGIEIGARAVASVFGYFLKGYIAGVAIHKKAVYTTAFTPPKTMAEMTNDTDTVLFLDFSAVVQGELVVYGETDVALLKTSDASSVYGAGYEADKVNDGDDGTSNHTNDNPNEWWKVDLGDVYTIDTIDIKKTSFGARPNDYYIQIANDYAFTSSVVNIITVNDEQSTAIVYTTADFGVVSSRYVRIIAHTTNQYVNMVHFEVITKKYSLLDLSSSEHVPTINNYLTGCTFWWSGAVEFDGDGDYLSVPYSSDWLMTTDFAIEWWVSFRSLQTAFNFLSGIAGSADYFQLFYMNDSDVLFATCTGMQSTSNVTASFIPDLGRIYHLMLTRSGTTYRWFIDGVLTGGDQVRASGPVDTVTGDWRIGWDGEAGREFDGFIAEHMVSKGITRHTITFIPPTAPYVLEKENILKQYIHGEQEQLFCEIERWDQTNEDAQLWVKVPRILHDQPTDLLLYYDNTQEDNTYIGDTSSWPAQQVWNSNFIAVYHMSQDPSAGGACILDSTSNENHGTPYGSMTSDDLVDGVIGKALDFDGVDDYINIGGNTSFDITSVTLESMVKTATVWDKNNQDYTIVMSKNHFYDSQPYYTLYMYERNADSEELVRFVFGTHDGTTGGSSTYLTSYNTGYDGFIYLAGGGNASEESLMYIDDVNVVTQGGTVSIDNIVSTNFFIGKSDYSQVDLKNFQGILAECRVSNIGRSSSWLKTTNYSNKDSLINISQADIFQINGYVKEFGEPVQREVYLYDRASGELMDKVISNTLGYYTLKTTISGAHNIVCLDATIAPDFDDLILSKVTPTETI